MKGRFDFKKKTLAHLGYTHHLQDWNYHKKSTHYVVSSIPLVYKEKSEYYFPFQSIAEYFSNSIHELCMINNYYLKRSHFFLSNWLSVANASILSCKEVI